MLVCRGLIVAALVALGTAAGAQSPADAVVQQLAAQGYVDFNVSRTLLGRVQVIALAPNGGRREIVFNPNTGEILRDYLEAAEGSGSPVVLDRPEDDAEASTAAPDQGPSGNGQGGGGSGGGKPDGAGGGGGPSGGNSGGGNPGNGGNSGGGGGNSGGGNPGNGGNSGGGGYSGGGNSGNGGNSGGGGGNSGGNSGGGSGRGNAGGNGAGGGGDDD
jgi:hypothetical protein